MSTFIKNLKFYSKLPVLVTMIISIFVSCFSSLTGTMDWFSDKKRQPEVSSQNILFLGAFARSQDIATDGESYFFSSKCGLIKTELDAVTRLALNGDAIPKELKEQFGSAHIGGITYYDGKLYAALEDSKVWKYPIVALYDAQTLKYTGEYFHLSAEHQLRGLPWIAIDAQNGYLYSSQRDDAPCLIAYDLKTMEFVKTIELSEPVHKAQGGDVHNGTLYLATNNDTQAVYKINVLTGACEKYFDRNLTMGSEGEGLTVLPTQDGALLHALDMGPLFINAYIRHYAEIV